MGTTRDTPSHQHTTPHTPGTLINTHIWTLRLLTTLTLTTATLTYICTPTTLPAIITIENLLLTTLMTPIIITTYGYTNFKYLITHPIPALKQWYHTITQTTKQQTNPSTGNHVCLKATPLGWVQTNCDHN